MQQDMSGRHMVATYAGNLKPLDSQGLDYIVHIVFPLLIGVYAQNIVETWL